MSEEIVVITGLSSLAFNLMFLWVFLGQIKKIKGMEADKIKRLHENAELTERDSTVMEHLYGDLNAALDRIKELEKLEQLQQKLDVMEYIFGISYEGS